MTVLKATIKAELQALYAQAETDPGLTGEEFADGLADIIRNAILSATVTTNVTGTLPDGPVSATGDGVLT